MSNLTPRIDRIDKNYIINGSFDFYQRSLDVYQGTDLGDYPTADRWVGNSPYTNLTGNRGSRRLEDAPSNTPLRYSNQFRYTSNGAGTVCNLNQRIESIFSRELVNQPISIGFWIKNTDMQNVNIKLYTADVTDVYGASTLIHTSTVAVDQSGSWAFVAFENITMPSDVKRGLEVGISFNTPTASGVEQTLSITGVKLNIGKVAQDFSLAGRNYAEELQLCQRYFEKSYSLDVPLGTVTLDGQFFGFKNSVSTSIVSRSVEMQTNKRTKPIVVFYSPNSGAVGFERNTVFVSGGSATFVSEKSFALDMGVSTTAEYIVRYHWQADAEL